MKRFKMFSVSILCLSIAAFIEIYIGSQRAEAQISNDVQYSFDEAGYVTAILQNGDVYTAHTDLQGNFTRWYCGNFWAPIGQIIPDALFLGDGYDLVAILPNGDIYRGGITGSTNKDLCVTIYCGNYWDGIVATEQSSWGSVKGSKE
jgi:hypothetical protein